MKKDYIKPTVGTVALRPLTQLCAASPFGVRGSCVTGGTSAGNPGGAL